MYLVEVINHIVGLGTLILQIVTAALLAVWWLTRHRNDNEVFLAIAKFLKQHAMMLAFATAFFASCFALYYSYGLGIQPCELCWYQRIFMFSLVALFLVALYKRDNGIVDYAIVLSGIGGLIALYHHALQTLGEGVLPCPAAPGQVSCAIRIIYEFGYITFPLVSFTVFAFLIVLMMFARRRA